ncbi:MAG: S26 family signal peptidase [Beijerinckiaceae bacterium]|mgnify:FL=1
MTRAGWLVATAFGVGGVIASIAVAPPKLLLWNASASVPIGLYALQPTDVAAVSDLLVVMPTEPLAAYLAERGYLPRGVPLLKRVAALPGQTVCRSDLTIVIDGNVLGRARKDDGMGRPLPNWQGCRVVASNEIFLMNWQSPDSFDGRYVGAVPRSSIFARAMPLWIDEAGDGRFVWRAATR